MDFKISGRHLDVTPAIKEYAERKTSRLPRYFDLVQEITVVLDQVNQGFEAEIIVDIEHADPILAKYKGEDLYACIDGATDRAERQLTDHKEKLRNRKHNTA